MSGNVFRPSHIEDEIYSIMDDYIEGIDLYNYGLCDAIEDYFVNHLHREYLMSASNWPNNEGGVCAISWVEGAYPKMVMFDYKY